MHDGQTRGIRHEDLLVQLGWVQRLAQRLVGDADVAADITQNVWLKTRGRELESERGLQRWLRALTRGLARDTRREADRRQARERAAARPEAQPSASEVVERSARQQQVSAAVMELDEPYRSTVLHRYMDDFPTVEIARRMSVTEEAVRQRLARARKMLRTRLDREFGGASGAWALALLGASPTPGAAAAASVGAGATSTTSTAASTASSIGTSLLTGAKVAAVSATVLGSVAMWRGAASPGSEVPDGEARQPAVVAHVENEEQAAPRRPGDNRRQLAGSVGEAMPPILLEEPPNEYVRAPLQMW